MMRMELMKQHNQTCQSFPEARNLSLSSYLIMPVQRIPRYTLLLQVCGSLKPRVNSILLLCSHQDLLKNTEESHPDYTNLKLAHTRIQQVSYL